MGDPDLTGKDVQAARTLVPDVSGFLLEQARFLLEQTSVQSR